MRYLILLFVLLSISIQAQPKLFTPVNFQEAYMEGTRSMDGKPGPNYWQNRASYDIRVAVTPGRSSPVSRTPTTSGMSM